MQNFHKLAPFSIPAFYVILLPLVSCSFHEEVNHDQYGSHKSIRHYFHKPSPQMSSDVTIHGVLLWFSLGFLMPIAILAIRMSSREEPRSTRLKILFYLHVILQILSALLATAGAVMSFKKFENSFSNSHQRLGLALYCGIWLQAFIGIFRPKRGKKERRLWYFVHWMLGTIISLCGIINIYTGLKAYTKKTRRSTAIWTVLFTAEVSFIAFFYLFQDKWEYMQKQGEILGNVPITLSNQQIPEGPNQKELLPEPCGKRNALKNLFD
ncbi:cytochrome b561 domain-containing protein At4g18260-like [Juglans microcarpa x Juglans regia]|uniref:cytochrome b561 domain-containing protein At4g18260-like n=1 Tax=Juglans microcarpa x Juglans regia TaxID=2249226 RepID=UPI001B7EEA43|nr:cytochrome b561 domain-containing protein At4g18260-like [Juglans microcarpa x Juglans regia]